MVIGDIVRRDFDLDVIISISMWSYFDVMVMMPSVILTCYEVTGDESLIHETQTATPPAHTVWGHR